jgi:hypothetical protein
VLVIDTNVIYHIYSTIYYLLVFHMKISGFPYLLHITYEFYTAYCLPRYAGSKETLEIAEFIDLAIPQ